MDRIDAAEVLAADLAYIDPRTDEKVLRAVDRRTVVTDGDLEGTARNCLAALLAYGNGGPVVLVPDGEGGAVVRAGGLTEDEVLLVEEAREIGKRPADQAMSWPDFLVMRLVPIIDRLTDPTPPSEDPDGV